MYKFYDYFQYEVRGKGRVVEQSTWATLTHLIHKESERNKKSVTEMRKRN